MKKLLIFEMGDEITIPWAFFDSNSL